MSATSTTVDPAAHRAAAQALLHALEADGLALAHVIAAQPLLQLTLLAIALVLFGGLLRGPLPLIGGVIRFLGNLALIAALLGTVLAVARYTSGGTLQLPGWRLADWRMPGLPTTPSGEEDEATVTGSETRVALSGDRQFWLDAEINGVRRRFLVDTGATLTSLTPATAEAAGLHPREGGPGVTLETANGRSKGALTTIDSLRVGTIEARHLEAVVVPALGTTNMLGMNFLSALASWRVEGKVLILVPHHPRKVEG